VYATHIFDGLEDWATHLAYVEEGQLKRLECVSSSLMEQLGKVGKQATLLSVVEPWLRVEKEAREKRDLLAKESPAPRRRRPTPGPGWDATWPSTDDALSL